MQKRLPMSASSFWWTGLARKANFPHVFSTLGFSNWQKVKKTCMSSFKSTDKLLYTLHALTWEAGKNLNKEQEKFRIMSGFWNSCASSSRPDFTSHTIPKRTSHLRWMSIYFWSGKVWIVCESLVCWPLGATRIGPFKKGERELGDPKIIKYISGKSSTLTAFWSKKGYFNARAKIKGGQVRFKYW